MTRFANLADGGRVLAEALRPVAMSLDAPLLVAIVPNGVPVADPIAAALGLPLAGAGIEREGQPRVSDVPDVSGRDVIVVDDGVETGTAARLIAAAIREGGAHSLRLAVPVCPRQTEAHLQAVYDEIIAIERPLGRRDLRWHYADFDTIDEAEARRRLEAR